MWVLLFLLSLLVHVGSRRRMAVVAGTFVAVSGLAYYAFLTAWLGIFLLVGIVRPVQIVLGLLAFAAGSLHVKEALAPGRGPSLAIPESAKPGLYARMRAIVRAENLPAAMAGVVAQHPAATLLIVVNIRNEAAEATLKAQAARLGFANNVVFTDPVPLHELSDHLAAADVAVVPRPSSHSYPVKLLNYMAAGKAIVCAASSANALSHRENGYVARDHDTADMAEGITWLIEDAAARADLGRNALATARSRFDWPELAGGVAALYRETIAHRRRIDPGRLPPILRRQPQT